MRGYDSKGYDRYDRAAYDRYYDDYSGGGRYSDYRARSRSPARDYYGGGGRERGGFEREYGEGYGRTGRKW